MDKLSVTVVALMFLQLAGCNDSPKPRQPPVGIVTESDTVEELKERRRSGDSTADTSTVPREREATAATEGRRRTPEERRQRAKAAAEAEAARDAQADRPTRAVD